MNPTNKPADFKTHEYVLCVWCGVTTDGEPEKMIEYLNEELGTKFIYEREFLTLPDTRNGKPVHNSGNRTEQLFWLPLIDVPTVAVPRLQYQIRWWDDYVDHSHKIVPMDILNYYAKEIDP